MCKALNRMHFKNNSKDWRDDLESSVVVSDKTMNEIKYQQGLGDGIFTVHTILVDMARTVESLHKQKRYHEIPNVVASALQGVALIWQESNERASQYIEKLKELNNIDFDPNQQQLVIDEETNELKIENI